MVLVLDNTKLPSLTYRTHVPIAELFQAFDCLFSATSKSKIFVSWNEDDSEALSVLRFDHDFAKHGDVYEVNLQGIIRPELDVLACWDVQTLRLSNANLDCKYPTFLSRLCLHRLELISADLRSWDFAKNHRLTRLDLYNCQIHTPTFENLLFLEHLWVYNSKLEPSMLRKCANLKRLTLVEFPSHAVARFREELPHDNVLVGLVWDAS